MLRRVRAADWRHPWVGDASLAWVVAAANSASVAEVGTSAYGWLWFFLVHLPLLWRRRAPVVVFWTVYALMAVGFGLMGPILREQAGAFQLIVALVALYAVARYRPWRYLWPAAAAIGIPLVLEWLTGELESRGLITIIAVAAAVVLGGMTLSTRRAYMDELEERARRAERERDQQARLAAAAERARIAREMHDIVAHNLAVMVALADGAAFASKADPERAADAMRKVSGTGREALAETRRLLGLLRVGEPSRDGGPPPTGAEPPDAERSPQPGLDEIDELVEGVRAAGPRVELTREGTPGEWGPGAGLAVYRIVQEALTNTLKHAGRQAIAGVCIRYTADGAELEVTDDGAGKPGRPPDGDPAAAGHGLAGMTERAASYGGHLQAGPRPGGGWRVHARLRFDPAEGAA